MSEMVIHIMSGAAAAFGIAGGVAVVIATAIVVIAAIVRRGPAVHRRGQPVVTKAVAAGADRMLAPESGARDQAAREPALREPALR